MPDGLWWLPSLVVLGVAAAAVVGGIVAFRRLGARRERAALESGRGAELRAKSLIVQADSAVREALAEALFVEAQFDRATAASVREAVEVAQRRLREAFLLQQRLDDAEPDTAAERRSWSARIVDLCESALATLAASDAALDARRLAERGASSEAPLLEGRRDALSVRRDEAAAMLDRLDGRFAASALGGAHDALGRADAALAASSEQLEVARGRLDRGLGAAEPTSAAAGLLERAARMLDEAERVESDLEAVGADALAQAAALEEELRAARAERDATEDPEARAALARAVDEAVQARAGTWGAGPGAVGAGAGAVVASTEPSQLPDPFAARDRLRMVRDRLEVARATARAARSRVDGARGALGGALAIAESQLGAAGEAIRRGGRRVGADARTRLAEAERQLVIARQEPDPVAALDAARRATARASDAEALAAYDLMGRR
ncbi:hypothetical protein BJ978_001742 [Agromyces terreus]|uniref:TPM domain-containing protein n=1 Tax=Agromyces terreus TaxID=424795 RepID=A0A9X2KC56_9MICO|nr:hypothetical protein [Agromyces terreus]MCP2371066.1 hypothetical protein [Agromyces terreus]